MTEWERLNVMVKPELKERLRELAHEKGLDLSSLVRLILTEASKKK